MRRYITPACTSALLMPQHNCSLYAVLDVSSHNTSMRLYLLRKRSQSIAELAADRFEERHVICIKTERMYVTIISEYSSPIHRRSVSNKIMIKKWSFTLSQNLF